jgi:hypothetical protein
MAGSAFALPTLTPSGRELRTCRSRHVATTVGRHLRAVGGQAAACHGGEKRACSDEQKRNPHLALSKRLPDPDSNHVRSVPCFGHVGVGNRFDSSRHSGVALESKSADESVEGHLTQIAQE